MNSSLDCVVRDASDRGFLPSHHASRHVHESRSHHRHRAPRTSCASFPPCISSPSALFSPSSSRVSVALNVHPLTATQILNTKASDCSFYRRSRPSKARSRAVGKSAIVTTAQSFPRATRTRHRGFSGDRPRGRAVVVTSSNARRTEARESHTEDASSRSKRKNKRCEQKIRAPTRNLTTTLIYSIKDCTGPMVWFV